MSKKYSIEFFQGAGASNNTEGGTDLDMAYKKGDSVINLIQSSGSAANTGASASASNSSAGANVEPVVVPQGIQMGNIWQFLGLDELTLKKKQCIYNCGIDLMGCMERCANPDCRSQEKLTHEQCRYGCMRKGINCSTNCISEIEVEPEVQEPLFKSNINNSSMFETEYPMTSSTSVTTSASEVPVYHSSDIGSEDTIEQICQLHNDMIPQEVQGVYSKLDTYAPFDMRVWPKEGKYGWTLSELNRLKRNGYDSPDVIEVSMNHALYPIKNTEAPVLEFDYAKNK